jgi:tetratricopeptide (TPR) repeat protein
LEKECPEVNPIGQLLGLRPSPPADPLPAPARLAPRPPQAPQAPQAPGEALGLQQRAERLEAAGRLSEALGILNPGLHQTPPEEALLLTALRIAISANDQETARFCISQANLLRLRPPRLALLADALRRMGRPEEALAVIEKALVQEPRSTKLLNDKGVLEAILGHFDRAQAALEGAIAVDPDLGSAYLSLGALLASRGETAQARQTYAAALSRRPIRDDPDLRRRLSSSLSSLPEVSR